MKLVEIKDIKIGQIRKRDEDDKIIVITDNEYNESEIDNINYKIYDKNMEQFKGWLGLGCKSRKDIRKYNIIGFLYITHKIEGDKLVEIPREEFEVGDIIKNKDNNIFVINYINNIECGFLDSNGMQAYQYLPKGYKLSDNCNNYTKIGIIGITHEFLNLKI